MSKKLVLLLTCFIILLGSPLARGQEGAREPVLVIHEAQESNKNLVAVEGYLMDDIFEVVIMARMKREKPRIHNAIVVGPGIGRLSCETNEILSAAIEEEDDFLMKRKDKGFINFGKDEDTKTVETVGESNVRKGRITNALYRFRIPRDRIKENKKYKLWVQILSSQKGSKYETYKFDLEDFAKLVLQQTGANGDVLPRRN